MSDSQPSQTSSDNSGSSSSTSSSSSHTTTGPVAAIPLTTTFTPASTCYSHQLTQQPSPGYDIWLNDPVPAPSHSFYECYPPQYIAHYTSASPSQVSFPAMSPLVCPLSWPTFSFTSNYIACCPPDFLLAYPTSTQYANRPAFGGTCYSDFVSGSTYTVTAYGTDDVTGTVPWYASRSGDQAFARPIEGWAISSSSSASVITVTNTPPASSSPTSESKSLSSGAIAGIVIGVLALVFLCAGAALFLIRRRRKSASENDELPHPALGGHGLLPVYSKDEQYRADAFKVPLYEVDANETARPAGFGERAAEAAADEPYVELSDRPHSSIGHMKK